MTNPHAIMRSNITIPRVVNIYFPDDRNHGHGRRAPGFTGTLRPGEFHNGRFAKKSRAGRKTSSTFLNKQKKGRRLTPAFFYNIIILIKLYALIIFPGNSANQANCNCRRQKA